MYACPRRGHNPVPVPEVPACGENPRAVRSGPLSALSKAPARPTDWSSLSPSREGSERVTWRVISAGDWRLEGPLFGVLEKPHS